MRARLSLGGAVALLFIAVVPAQAGPDNPNEVHGSAEPVPCNNALGQPEGEFTYTGTLEAWPPNHKYESVTITLTETDDADPLDEVTIAAVGTHDQYTDGVEWVGSGNTDDDVVVGTPDNGTGSATVTAQFRSERSGIPADGDNPWAGRTYTFTVTGTVDSGTTSCSATFTSTVAHDQGNHGDKP